jgi:bacterioferritin (cytochrome b1)
MQIAERIRLWLSPGSRLLDQLAEIAAQSESLAANLTRHAEMCDYPTLKSGIEELAKAETAQANALRELLLAHNCWPKLSKRALREGSSNWERLRDDLALQVRILRALQAQIPGWTSIDREMADGLRQFAVEEDRSIARLRDLTLKCDPQAID